MLIAKLGLFISLNVEDNAGAEMLFGGVDVDESRDSFAREVGGFVEFDLDLGGVLVAHGL